MSKIDRENYNTLPEGFKEISLEEFTDGIFHYCLDETGSRQVRNDPTFGHCDLRTFWLVYPQAQEKQLGYAIMRDWFNISTGKNRPETIIRFCRFGTQENWRIWSNAFTAQFAGDNS